jgi:hypothetical protein
VADAQKKLDDARSDVRNLGSLRRGRTAPSRNRARSGFVDTLSKTKMRYSRPPRSGTSTAEFSRTRNALSSVCRW